MRSVPGVGSPAPLVAWIAGLLAVAGTTVAAVLLVGADAPLPWKALLLPVLWSVPGVLIASGRPHLAVGWLILAVGLFFVGIGLAGAFLERASGPDVAGAAAAVWYLDRGSAFLVPCGLLALLLLPDGRLPTRAWRPVAGACLGLQVLLISVFCLLGGPAAGPESSAPEAFRGLANPVGVLPAGLTSYVENLDWIGLQLPMLLIPVAIGHRLVRADRRQRPALVALLLAATTFVLILVVGQLAWPAAGDVLQILGSALLAAVIAGTVLARRSGEIEYAVHHAFVFAVLTVLVAGGYVAASSVAGRAGEELPASGAGVVAAVIALALLPLRTRLQGWVGRLLYGDRRDPYAALTRLADSTRRVATVDDALAEVAGSVAASLRVPWVCVAAADRTAESGQRPAGAVVAEAPLVAGDQEIGSVSVAFDPSRRWRGDDAALLDALGRHGGMAVHAVALAEAVRASRQRLVEAREEERRRVGRNLHDGLGPTLASITMQLGALRHLVPACSAAEDRLVHLEEVSRAALDELRRVARELRPTALDQFGLVEALQRHAEGLGIDLATAADGDPVVPAAVEVAAYRIGQQAIANVAAHAGVRAATLRLTLNAGELQIEVADRGAGFASAVEGVGLSSMRERAEELGGCCAVTSTPGGTLVAARIPLPRVRLEVAP